MVFDTEFEPIKKKFRTLSQLTDRGEFMIWHQFVIARRCEGCACGYMCMCICAHRKHPHTRNTHRLTEKIKKKVPRVRDAKNKKPHTPTTSRVSPAAPKKKARTKL